jgi:hypothetical protein
MATQTYTTSNNTLELDGQPAGPLRRIEGGNAFADVLKQTPDSVGGGSKRLGKVKYEDLVLGLGAETSSAVYAWIADMFARQDQPKTGAVVLSDSAQAATRMEFVNAHISEVTFPALNSESTDVVASLTLKLAPEYTQASKGSVAAAKVGAQQGRWVASNFQLQIDGLATTGVSRIDALTVKRASSAAGDNAKDSRTLDVPDLVFVTPENGADALIAWHENMVIKGNSEQKKNGSLRFMAGAGDALFTLTFSNLGIFSLAREPLDAGSTGPRRLRASLFCEGIGLQYTAAATPNPLNLLDVNVTPYAPPPLTNLSIAPTVSPYTPPAFTKFSVVPSPSVGALSPTGRFSQQAMPQPFAGQLDLPQPPPTFKFRT